MQADGSFTPSENTRIVASAADAQGLDFLVLDNFLPAETCDTWARFHAANADHFDSTPSDSFWRNRLLSYPDILEIDPSIGAQMRIMIGRTRRLVLDFYKASGVPYVDCLHLVGWPVGMFMPPHADSAHESGEPHEFAWRDFSVVVYLTDQPQGGGVYLPKQDVLITPRKGMLVSLPAGLSHMHGVTKVESLRVTMAAFLTFDAAHADRNVHPVA